MLASLLLLLLFVKYLGDASATPALRAPRVRARARGALCGEPTGSWAATCSQNVQLGANLLGIDRAAGTITTQCKFDSVHSKVNKDFEYCSCVGQEVWNNDGNLACAKGRQARPGCGEPRGTFRDTCTDIIVSDGGTVEAECKSTWGFVWTQRTYYCNCKDLDVFNNDGAPKCAKGTVPPSYDSAGKMIYIVS